MDAINEKIKYILVIFYNHSAVTVFSIKQEFQNKQGCDLYNIKSFISILKRNHYVNSIINGDFDLKIIVNITFD